MYSRLTTHTFTCTEETCQNAKTLNPAICVSTYDLLLSPGIKVLKFFCLIF